MTQPVDMDLIREFIKSIDKAVMEVLKSENTGTNEACLALFGYLSRILSELSLLIDIPLHDLMEVIVTECDARNLSDIVREVHNKNCQ